MIRPEAPAPLSRRGPRPLLLHLTLAWMKSSGLGAGSTSWNGVWQDFLNGKPNDPKAAPWLGEMLQTDRDLIAGIAAYREAPYQRGLPDMPAVWEEGETRLLDYAPGAAGQTVLFVPSLINRAYILDLMEGGTMLRWLAARNVHPYLLDWGWPGPAERQFTLTDYIAGRLERATAAIAGKVVLAGYCMGGLLALAAALRQPEKISALALLATPWDFQAADPAAARRLGEAMPLLEPMLGFSGTLPIDALQTLFTMLDPYGVGEKYRDFAQADKASLRAQRFVAMEDWLADGVPLAAPVARETLAGWYGANSTAHGNWRVAGLAVDPKRIAVPSFCAIPARDRLVPPESARPLAALLDGVRIVEPAAGHVGMIAGGHAQTALWEPFADWLQGLG
jgi:polyhydroxyalkanoate synthase